MTDEHWDDRRQDAMSRWFASRPYRYVLDHRGEPEPCDDDDRWSRWFATDERRVVRQQPVTIANPEVDPEPVEVLVSTVFLGIDHNFSGEGPPVLWETLVLPVAEDAADRPRMEARYVSRDAAIAGHNAIVRLLGGQVLER